MSTEIKSSCEYEKLLHHESELEQSQNEMNDIEKERSGIHERLDFLRQKQNFLRLYILVMEESCKRLRMKTTQCELKGACETIEGTFPDNICPYYHTKQEIAERKEELRKQEQERQRVADIEFYKPVGLLKVGSYLKQALVMFDKGNGTEIIPLIRDFMCSFDPLVFEMNHALFLLPGDDGKERYFFLRIGSFIKDKIFCYHCKL